jgi:very-short-patch-repair endonuclease
VDKLHDYVFTADRRQYGKLGLNGCARAMRHQPTEAEHALWQELRGGRVGAKFRRQHPIDRYIVDFVCISSGLVVETDGGGHDAPDQADYDTGRSALLWELGFRVLRFSNEQVLNDLPVVLAAIKAALAGSRE